MTAIVNNDIRVFSANQFLNSFDNKKYDPWTTGTSTTIGKQVFNGNYKYIAVSAGTTGASAPAHTSGVISDGGVDWLFVESFTNLDNFQNNVYLAIGRTGAWDNPTAGGETPVDPSDNFSAQYGQLASIISAKRLEQSNVKLAIKRHNWDTSGSTVYSQFDPDVEALDYVAPFYVIVDSKIYKCLNNNRGTASTTQPTGTSAEPFVTAGDGYLWQFMGEINSSDALQFLTPAYAPVELKLADDGSAQWNVQQNARAGSLSTIVVENGGSGYSNATISITAPPAGTTATATPVISGGAITAVQLSVIGEGYETAPTVSISGNGTGAVARAVLAPKDGHGANILKELGARYAVINTRFDDSENGYFPISGDGSDFRQISIIVDPVDVDGGFAEAARYIGPDHPSYTGNGTSGLSEFQKGSGTTLYIETIEPVVRSAGQVEDIKIVLQF